ncbi:MAG: hypothetical protein R3F60_05250 [bacterium]
MLYPPCVDAPCLGARVSFRTSADRFAPPPMPAIPYKPEGVYHIQMGCGEVIAPPQHAGVAPLAWSYDDATGTWAFSCFDPGTGWSIAWTLARPRVELLDCTTHNGNPAAPVLVVDDVTRRFSDGVDEWVEVDGGYPTDCASSLVDGTLQWQLYQWIDRGPGEPMGEQTFYEVRGLVRLPVPPALLDASAAPDAGVEAGAAP